MSEGVLEPNGGSIPRKNVASIAVRVALLAVAFLVLRRALDGVGVNDLFVSLRGYGIRHLGLSIAFTALSFVTLGMLELVALQYVGKRAERIVPKRSAMATAFVAHAYSQSVGLAILTGTGVRIRSYSRYGLDSLDVARLSVFVTVSATLGLLTTGAVAFVTMTGPVVLRGFTLSMTAVGLLLLLPVVAYAAWGTFGRSDFHGRGSWRIRRPSLVVAAEQIGISSLDWVLAGTVLFFLLPTQLHWSYSGFLGVYLVAQTVAVLSHVPGGVGVFEAMILILLTADASDKAIPPAFAASVAASLIVYRIVYYLLPLCVAIVLSVVAEMIRMRGRTTGRDETMLSSPSISLSADAI